MPTIFDDQDKFDRLAQAMRVDTRNPVAIRARIEVMERLLERSFVIPGTRQTIGLDSIVGLVPGIGDLITAAMGAYIVWEARNLGMSKWHLVRMAGNIGIDTLLGALPIAGDVFDFMFKSNSRNLRLIKKHLDRHHPSSATLDINARPVSTAPTPAEMKRLR